MRKPGYAEEPEELPKGIQRPTLDALSECLMHRADEELSTEQIALELGISRMTVSKYLEF